MSFSKKTRPREEYQTPIEVAVLHKSTNEPESENSTSNGDNNLPNQVLVKPKPSTPLQPRCFLALPPEIRLVIYELVLGVDRRIHMNCAITGWEEGLEVFLGHEKPAFDLWNECTCYSDSYLVEESTSFVTVWNDVQTDKQQHATERSNFCAEISHSHVLNQAKASTGRQHNVDLLRTCRQIYYEARLVLYRNTTFLFSCPAIYAAYFGFSTPSGVHLPCSTEAHTLRTIQAMTKVKIRVIIGQDGNPDFLLATRLIRALLGCLTNLESFELGLQLEEPADDRRKWRIDDSMFIKSSSLRELVLRVWTSDYDLSNKLNLTEEDALDIANELLRRLLKQEGFSDTIECFRRDNDSAATTESL